MPNSVIQELWVIRDWYLLVVLVGNKMFIKVFLLGNRLFIIKLLKWLFCTFLRHCKTTIKLLRETLSIIAVVNYKIIVQSCYSM